MTITLPSNERRRVWHSLVDSAIDRPLHAGAQLPDSVGLFAWAPSRPEVLIYANKVLCAVGSSPRRSERG